METSPNGRATSSRDRGTIQGLIDSGAVQLDDPATWRISPYEVIAERGTNAFQIVRIPAAFQGTEHLTLILDYFTTKYHHFENASRTTRARSCVMAVEFLEYLTNNYENLLSIPVAISRYINHLKKYYSAGAIRERALVLKKIFSKAIDEKYPKISERPISISEILKVLSSIQPKVDKAVKKPALGRYLSISHEVFSNKQLLMGMRLGCMWLLNKVSDFRHQITSLPAVAEIIVSLSDLTESEIERTLPSNPYLISKKNAALKLAEYDQWVFTNSNELLREWQFYYDKKFRRHSLDYGAGKDIQLFSQTAINLYMDRSTDHQNRRARPVLKGLGQKDIEWRVFRPIYRAARNCSRPGAVLWGIDWLRQSSFEKLLFVWLLSTERVQTSGIKSMTTDCLELDRQDNPKSIQIHSLKLRRGGSRSMSRSMVRGQIYRKHHPPFHTYFQWRSTCLSAIKKIKDHNPSYHLIPKSGTALAGQISTDTKLESHTLFRLLITDGTFWQDAFLAENSDHRTEALAFIEILRNRILAPNRKSIPSLAPEAIATTFVLEKELETNQSERDATINSAVSGHTTETGRNIYKDGFFAAEVAEITDPVNAFIRRMGDERFKEAITLSNQLANKSRKICLAELKEISNFTDSELTIRNLTQNLREEDRLLLSGEIDQGNHRVVIETDFIAAIMGSYIEHLEESLPIISSSERTDRYTQIIGELIYLTQTLASFPEDIKAKGKKLKDGLDIKFPPVT